MVSRQVSAVHTASLPTAGEFLAWWAPVAARRVLYQPGGFLEQAEAGARPDRVLVVLETQLAFVSLGTLHAGETDAWNVSVWWVSALVVLPIEDH